MVKQLKKYRLIILAALSALVFCASYLKIHSTNYASSVALQTIEFKELEQSLGVTYHPRALLLDATLDNIVRPVEVYVHDWMHGIFVDGVFNIVVFPEPLGPTIPIIFPLGRVKSTSHNTGLLW